MDKGEDDDEQKSEDFKFLLNPEDENSIRFPSYITYVEKDDIDDNESQATGKEQMAVEDDRQSNYDVIVGQKALSLFHLYPRSTVYDIKKLLGRKLSDKMIQKGTD